LAQSSELAGLAERRDRLLEQSSALRIQIANDFAGLKSSTVWIESGYRFVKASRAIWPFGAVLAGLFLGRKGGSWMKRIGGLLSCWRLARKATALFRVD
jgi:hypothetical protein